MPRVPNAMIRRSRQPEQPGQSERMGQAEQTIQGEQRRRFELSPLMGYSRFVARAKLVLPIIAAFLLIVLAVWPYLSIGMPQLISELKKLEPKALHDARMVQPHFTGIDKEDRPFTLTADAARQSSVDTGSTDGSSADRADGGAPDSLVALEAPKAKLLNKEGRVITATGTTGLYQFQTHFLDLFGGVTLAESRGFTFLTHTARVDLVAGTAEGQEPVAGTGPSGTVAAEGFRVLDKGDVVYFTGHSHLVLNAAHGGSE